MGVVIEAQHAGFGAGYFASLLLGRKAVSSTLKDKSSGVRRHPFADAQTLLAGTSPWILEQVLDLEGPGPELLGDRDELGALFVLLLPKRFPEIEKGRELNRMLLHGSSFFSRRARHDFQHDDLLVN